MIRINFAPTEAIEERRPNAVQTARELVTAAQEAASSVKGKILALGIPGLLIYNIIDGAAHAGIAYAAQSGEPNERILASSVVGGLAVITNASFWLLVGLTGIKLREKIAAAAAIEPIPEPVAIRKFKTE